VCATLLDFAEVEEENSIWKENKMVSASKDSCKTSLACVFFGDSAEAEKCVVIEGLSVYQRFCI
jgi:hypothetical protein